MLASNLMQQMYTPRQNQLVADTDHVRALEIERELGREPIWWGIDWASGYYKPGSMYQEYVGVYAEFDAAYTKMLFNLLRPGLLHPRRS